MKFGMFRKAQKFDLQPVRAALVGTGYIAHFHAQALSQTEGVRLVSVCDFNLSSAESFGAAWRVPAFNSLEAMLQTQEIDAVHVLVPPDHHYPLAKLALLAGVHVFIEKPMCSSVQQADDLLELARNSGLHIGVNHNMLYAGPYQQLRKSVHSGALGPLDYININHFLELAPIRVGPFNSWMLREPGNVFLEIGPHLLSIVLDLVGEPEEIAAVVDREVILPGGANVFRRWRVRTTVAGTAVDINVNLGPGFSNRTVNVHGLLGSATVDFDANTCTVDRRTALSVDVDRFRRSQSMAGQLRSQAQGTLADYALSKLKLRRRGNPYQVTILDSVAAFYSGLRANVLDTRVAGESGRQVIDLCNKVISSARIASVAVRKPGNRVEVRPTVLVFGGTGFIGRELIRQLLVSGYGVRALVRGSGAVLEEHNSERLEIVSGNIRSKADLESALTGIEFVYHLARSDAKTWEDYLKVEVEPTRLIAEACLTAGVKRLVYTGTIDSYYAGAKAGTITELTPLDPQIHRRNYYARAKAAAEALLVEMHKKQGLPLVIFRPGIVIGRGGNPFHWGVGMWVSEGVCVVWGAGNNKLPFVLVSDVAAALVRGIQVSGLEGRSYNLVDVPLLTARDYLNELAAPSRA